MRSGSLSWLLLLAFLVLPAAAQPAAGPLPLTSAQREYLLAHPTIVVGYYDSGWPPFEAVRGERVEGMGPEILSQLADRLGLQLRLRRLDSWAEVLNAACRGEIDVVMNVSQNSERNRCLIYTAPYVQSPLAIVGRIGDLKAARNPDLDGLRVVVEQNFLTGPQVRARYPRARQQVAASTLQALKLVEDDKADVFIGNAYVADRLIATQALTRLELMRASDLPLERLHLGIATGRPLLADAFDRALAAQSQSSRDALAARWLPVPRWSTPAGAALSDAERQVLRQPLRIGFAPNAAPLAFTGADGAPSGLVSGYLRLLEDAGAHLRPQASVDWFDVREKLRRGELDALMGIPNDASYLGPDWVFSQPFITVPNVIVTRRGSPPMLGLADLQGRRVLVSDPQRVRGYVLRQAPQARLVAARSFEQALERLADGEADAMVGNLAVVDRLIRERFAHRLQVAAPAGFNDALALAVDGRHAALATTFDRLLAQQSPQQRDALRATWLEAPPPREPFSWRPRGWGLPVLLVLATALLVFAWGHWRLRREVAHRRHVEQRLADVTLNLPAIVYQAHRDAEGVLRFPFIAGDTRGLFGIDRQQAMDDAQALLARIDPRDRAAVEQAIDSAARGFDSLAFEFRVAGGEQARWVRTQAHPYAAEAGAVTWSGYWVDVTDARQQADALAAAKVEAEQAADARSRFLATMSHEIRTPMGGVLGMLEVLAHSPLDGHQQGILRTIGDSAEMLRQILDDILDYSRIEAGALRLEPVPLQLRPLLEGVVRLLSAQASTRGLDLQVDIDPQLAAAHEVDGVRLRQVVFNLLGNAIKFTPKGSVRLQVDVLEEDHEQGTQSLRLTVSDTGVGIAPEQMERLFEPFQQAGAYTQRDFGGTGLGLSICQRLVTMMGGELALHSALGEGTRVEVMLVLGVARSEDVALLAAEQAQSVLLPAALRQARVLVAEDHPTNQAMMAWRLQQLGVPHVLVEDGQQALDLLASEPFDLVITDCRMPVLDGFAFTRVLREREGRSGQPRLPVLALTASVLDEDTRRCREAGMDDVLAKPLTLATLRHALLRWLPAVPLQAAPAAAPSPADAGGDEGLRAQLEQRFGPQVALQLCDSLQQSGAQDLPALRDAIDRRDRDAVAGLLHRQAGALGAIGATARVTHATALIEALRAQQDWPDAELRAFADDLQQMLRALDQ
ncbi:transporter substrate-binding domain-containing protein [Stenotrophomonas sp. 24(2023)]|uniref:ATP-binding protein n=1 Tax=Stenotrophomonas sp. 24(2023) TaxID=3068324 RepID=UPI0027E18849|nr:transporter substrate-binding domain-containing protein [Stenotrophomonas sp. 24(2023)]WMJ71243.1 transporter substrate-binding domain-containing protein [Stenotrophomonas sp. 24(2023)]